MRRSVITIILMLTSIGFGAMPSAAQSAGDAYVFSGGGWGHGVGMSQFGAQALALTGETATEILDYYYTDVDHVARQTLYADTHLLGEDNPDLWIGLLQDQMSFEFTIPSNAAGGVSLCQAGDGLGQCPRQDIQPAPGETWSFGQFEGPGGEELCRFERVSPSPLPTPAAEGSCKGSVTWGGAGQAEIIEIDGNEYKHGRVRIRQGADQVADWTFHVALEVELELYLRGLAEVPLSWHHSALEAQVIAGRTYAVASTAARYSSANPAEPISTTWQNICFCHLRDTPADQNYTGWTHESDALGPKWVDAVNVTADTVLAQAGSPITAWYSSSTGGVTENSEDVFGSFTGWARSVPDPWSLDPAAFNPFATWEEPVPVIDIAVVLGFDSITDIELLSPAPNATMEVTGTKNGTSTVSVVEIPPLYSALGLRSPTVLGIEFAPNAAPPAFDDISSSVHYTQINQIAALGITVGCNPPVNNLYCPKNDVSRAQMSAFLRRAFNLSSTSLDFFTDDDDIVFEDDINRISAVATADLGCGGSLFCPWQPITRSEMALFIVSTLNLPSLGNSDFVDIGGDPNATEIKILADHGITVGCNPPTYDQFCPDEHVTRAQMASFIMRSLDVAAAQ